MRLYLDGCSLTYGQGLPRHQSLGQLFADRGGFEVTDLSRPGKSNLAIAVDVFNHADDYDLVILGWSFSERFTIRHHSQDLDFYPGSHGRGFDLEPQALDLDHLEMQKYFFSVFGPPFCDDLSDMLVESTISNLCCKQKRQINFSWQARHSMHVIHYPYISKNQRLPDGHLNTEGMITLYNYLQNILT